MSFQVISPDHTFQSIRGRIGDFVFKTYKNGKIFAYYMPRRGKRAKPDPDQSRSNPDAISVRFREITDSLNLQIVES